MVIKFDTAFQRVWCLQCFQGLTKAWYFLYVVNSHPSGRQQHWPYLHFLKLMSGIEQLFLCLRLSSLSSLVKHLCNSSVTEWGGHRYCLLIWQRLNYCLFILIILYTEDFGFANNFQLYLFYMYCLYQDPAFVCDISSKSYLREWNTFTHLHCCSTPVKSLCL